MSGRPPFRSESPGPRGNAGPSARWLAFLAIQSFAQRGSFVSKALDDLFTEFPTLPRDRHLATELASETVRRGLTLDSILAQYVTRPREKVEDELWMLLQLGACQLICLSHIPAHAAVHETVSLCDRLYKPRAKGFINGTLRSIERELNHQTTSDNQPLELKDLGPDLLPIFAIRGNAAGLRIVKLARRVFADPKELPLDYIAQVASLPVWLLQHWAKEETDLNRLLARALWFTTPGKMSLRVNLQRTTREAVLDLLRDADVAAQPGQLPVAIALNGSLAPGEFPAFHDGGFSVQDESAIAAVALLDPQPGESILDLCAAPGGKTCHIAERLQGTGRVIACDLSNTRLRPIRENITRLQLSNIDTLLISEEGRGLPDGPFDAALVDVPCSNTGVLGKRPEARWRITPATFADLIPLQRRLLNDALDRVKSGGRVLYSTCSIDRSENEDLVNEVITARNDVQLKTAQRHEPGSPGDGGYQALLLKS
ncbi:transcription antitermination factor NusB [Planctomicrobium piriforme]|uniref:16S rRNA (Cytosine967-C5)-methyltransferase n=1 Tax=Planctomicrobium piriforme TaxID=1576369 RepID=A0A1I3G2G0_9PLAN|nr:transcription antitermination factor NusB [Planctomicrobium piriforme]SFI17660.1 16S rRNA (cytosine967-C5)-methyltransferase [Planctomicrobium piriforme]